MTELHFDIGYTFTRIHAPFSRDYSVIQGPNATSYFNAFQTYDFLLSIGMKPWIELGYTPCWMSGPAAVPAGSYWPTVDYGICVGSPGSMDLWTDMIYAYVGAMVARYGVEEVESWMWVRTIQSTLARMQHQPVKPVFWWA
jgi:xylan 1,4-beta-xylosidase